VRTSSDADICTFWCKKLGFFEIYGVSEWIRGEFSQRRHFADRVEGSVFRDIVRTSHMDGTLRIYKFTGARRFRVTF